MTNITNPRIILTGGPCAGKTTLINALKARSFTCREESGRAIIQDQTRINGNALPWKSPLLFAEMMLTMDMHAWHRSGDNDIAVFYDRGIPDIAGYLSLTGEEIPVYLINAIDHFRYAPKVILLPPWKAIYQQDTERRQSWGEAVRTYEAMCTTYEQYGYQLLELPPAPVAIRLEQLIQLSEV